MAAKKAVANQFVVDLGDLELPAETAQQLNRDIRKLVLTTLAGVDFKGDLRVSAKLPRSSGRARTASGSSRSPSCDGRAGEDPLPERALQAGRRAPRRGPGGRHDRLPPGRLRGGRGLRTHCAPGTQPRVPLPLRRPLRRRGLPAVAGSPLHDPGETRSRTASRPTARSAPSAAGTGRTGSRPAVSVRW